MKADSAQIETIRKPWEQYISEGMEARELKDKSSWALGDLTCGITTDYGDDTIGKFGYAIGVKKKTLMNYRTVAERFDEPIREKYPKLSFSHYATLTAVEKPEAWLEKADTEEWSVEMLRGELKKAKDEGPKLDDKPPKVYRCPECGLWRLKDISAFEICKGHYKITKHGLKYQ